MGLSDNARDFWLAAAAAAPIIALAGLVAITDAAVTGDIIKRARKQARGNRELLVRVAEGKEVLGPPSRWVSFYNRANLVGQSIALIVALLALLQNGTPIPGVLVIVVEGTGLLFLFLAALLAGGVEMEKRRWDEEMRRGTTEQPPESG